MSAYWAENRDIGDTEVLVAEASPLGLDPDEVRDVAQTSRYRDRIAESTTAVLEMGAGGVPAWVVDDRVLIPGAQPHELFERVLEKLGHGGETPDSVP
jgi:predicted DsbA family dithiol-disulfide isomerase